MWIYTPLKSRSVWQTPIGAVAGAMPVLLGAAAVGALARPVAWTLFGVVFFWQFPHSMAIAWLYREQFALAEVKLATVVDPSGRAAGWLAVGGRGPAAAELGAVWLTAAAIGNMPFPRRFSAVLYLGCALAFLRHAGERTARLFVFRVAGLSAAAVGLFAGVDAVEPVKRHAAFPLAEYREKPWSPYMATAAERRRMSSSPRSWMRARG